MLLKEAIDKLRPEFVAHDLLRAELSKIYLNGCSRFAALHPSVLVLIHRFVGHLRKTYNDDPMANSRLQFRLFTELYQRHQYTCSMRLHRVPLEIAFGMKLPPVVLIKHCGDKILIKAVDNSAIYAGKPKLEPITDVFSAEEINKLHETYPLPCGLVVMKFHHRINDKFHVEWLVYDPETHQKIGIADPVVPWELRNTVIFDDLGSQVYGKISNYEYTFSELSGHFLACRLD